MASQNFSLLQSFQDLAPRYLFGVIPTAKRADVTRNVDKLLRIKVKHNYLKNFFFPLTVIE